jgi:methionyl-tRNA formyltransferase
MRLVFMGTPAFAVPTLEWLIEAGHDIAAVYTQPPRPAGRGRKLRSSPVQQLAEARGIAVLCPERLRDPADQAAFAALEADAAVVVAYGLILPKAILDAPRLGCINLHASLLPRWRGAAPIQRAVMAGDPETGVCAMLMEPGLDTGPVLACAATPIGETETAGALADRLAHLGAPLVGQALEGLAAGTLAPVPQPEAGVVYAHKIDKAEAKIDWSRPAAEIAALIRGLNPAPGAFTHLGGERRKVWAATPVGGDGAPGTTLDDVLTVACGHGALQLDRVQREGRPAVERTALLAGLPVPPGTRLGDD